MSSISTIERNSLAQVLEYLDLSGILSFVTANDINVSNTSSISFALTLLKCVFVQDMDVLIQDLPKSLVSHVVEIHFVRPMRWHRVVPFKPQPSLVETFSHNIVQFMCKFSACELVVFWGDPDCVDFINLIPQRTVDEKLRSRHAIEVDYAGDVLDNISRAYANHRLRPGVKILGLKCPNYLRHRREHDPPCPTCTLILRHWPAHELVNLRPAEYLYLEANRFMGSPWHPWTGARVTLSEYNRNFRRRPIPACAWPYFPLSVVSCQPGHTRTCTTAGALQEYLIFSSGLPAMRSCWAEVDDPGSKVLDILRSAYRHKFKPGYICGRVYYIVSLDEDQLLRLSIIVNETGFDLNSLHREDVKRELRGSLTSNMDGQERWYFREAERLRVDFGFNLNRTDWADHFLPISEYSLEEGLLLSVMFNLRFHVPHLEPNDQIKSFYKDWLHNPKRLTYEEMIGLPFSYNPAKVLCSPLTKAYTQFHNKWLEDMYKAWREGSIELTMEEMVEFGFKQWPMSDNLGMDHKVYEIDPVTRRLKVDFSFYYTRGTLSFGIPIEIVGAGCVLDNAEGLSSVHGYV